MRPGCRIWRVWLVAALTIAVGSLANTEAAAQFGGGGPPRDRDTALAFSNDGEILAGGGLDKLRFWDVQTGKLIRTAALPVSWVYSIAFAPQSRTLYAACDDGQIYTCDADTGELNLAIDVDADRIYAIAFSPDGTFLACAIEHHVDANPDLKVGMLRLWDVGRQTLLQPLFSQNDLQIYGLRYSHDGKTLGVAVSESSPRSGAIRLWDVATGTWKQGFTVANMVKSVDFAPDGDTLAIGGSLLVDRGLDQQRRGVVSLWNAENGKVVWERTGPPNHAFQIAFAPDGQSIVGGAADWKTLANGDRVTVSELSMWDSKTGHLVWRVIGKSGMVHGLRFSPDGKFIASSSNGETKLSDALTGATKYTLLSQQ